jgi:outer membrane protein
LSSRYTIGDHWSIDATVTYRRLMSGAADSPIVADEGSRNQVTAAIYGSYSF